MSDLDPEERRLAMDARMDGWGAHMRAVMRMSLGLGPERAPWDEPNEEAP